MYFADNHINGMLWGIRQESVDPETHLYIYRIPGLVDDTVITGEWVRRNDENMCFLVHHWDNGCKRKEICPVCHQPDNCGDCNHQTEE